MVTVEPKDFTRLEAIATKYSIPYFQLGTVGGDRLVVRNKGANMIGLPLPALSATWRGSLPAKAGLPAAAGDGSEGKLLELYDNIQDYIDKNWD